MKAKCQADNEIILPSIQQSYCAVEQTSILNCQADSNQRLLLLGLLLQCASGGISIDIMKGFQEMLKACVEQAESQANQLKASDP